MKRRFATVAFLGCVLAYGVRLPAQLTVPPSGVITTVTGTGYWGYSGDGGPATSATVSRPTCVVVDSAGNVYFADGFYGVIRKVMRSTGIVSTIVGTGTQGYSGDGGPATLAQIQSVQGMALDAAGNLYISDSARIRKVTASTGIISTIAGNGNWGYSGDGGPATSASLENNGGVAVDSAGNVYFTDEYNAVVREVWAATGIITTVAGNGTAGYSGDGGAATSAELNMPYGIAVDPAGNLYIADSGANVIRKVTWSTGKISTVAGNGTAGYAGDGGSATSAELNIPAGDVAVDPLGNLYLADSGNNAIRMIAASTGVISTIAGNSTAGFAGDGSLAVNAELNSPQGLALDSVGNIYFADNQNDRIRAVGSVVQEPGTTMPTITWTPPASIGYGTPLSATQLDATASVQGTFNYQPAAGAVLPSGLQALMVVFTPTNQSLYSIAMATVPLTVHALTPTITWPTPALIPYGVPLGASQLNATANVPGTFSYNPVAGTVLSPGTYTLNATFTPNDTAAYNSVSASVSLTVSILPSSGIIATLAGNGYWGYSGDGGPAIDATMSRPRGVAIDAAGNIYFVDESNSVVRKVTASPRIISTIAGNGTSGYSGDGGAATNAEIGDPDGIALDSAGNIYIADAEYAVVRKVSASTGIITTVAGDGVRADSGDGGPATSAELCDVSGVAVDGAGNIYIADTGNNKVRKVDASTGIINTIAGSHVAGYSGDGGPATSAILNGPNDVVLDSAGNLYFSDNGNNVVRKISTSGVITTVVGTGVQGYTGDGGPATAAELSSPRDIALDSAGNLYLADEYNCVIRQVSVSSGIIATAAGSGCSGFSGDGGSATSAQLSYPSGVAVDAAGNFYISDSANVRVRVVGSSAPSSGAVSVAPPVATLHPGQQQPFSAIVTGLGSSAVTWSINPVNLGAITQSGQYTAPVTIANQQTVIVTASSQADPTKSGSATITLIPGTVSVSISPSSASLNAGSTLQFNATVTNTSNTAVTWSISPAGTGTISTGGLYTAPSTISTQMMVTITATSQADTTKSASAAVYLLPPCVSNGYSYVRPIVIDHTKVPNTDQIHFPFLLSSIDPAFKTTSKGGHVASSNGYDIIFSSDAAGTNVLPFEQESYSSSTGAIIYWINVPAVSHTTDTVIYMWYGNSNITANQGNASGVWSSGYAGVYHFPNGTTVSANDSTANGDSGTITGVTATTGVIDGGASFGNPGYVALPNLSNYAAADFTVSTWVNFSSLLAYNVIMVGKSQASNVLFISTQSNGQGLRMGRTNVAEDASASFTWSTNTWYYVALTRRNGVFTFYVNGAALSTNNEGGGTVDYVNTNNDIGGDGGSYPLYGSLDEFRISNTSRSADWIATEFGNQNSPSTFYTLEAEANVAVSPAAVALYASQSQKFTAEVLGNGSCLSGVVWSITAGSPGTLTADGLYTAPSSISAEQTVLVTATTQSTPSMSGTAEVTLIPEVNPTLTLSATNAPPYATGSSQQFRTVLTNRDGTPIPNVSVQFNVTGANTGSGTASTDGNGAALFLYTGANSGNDTIQASASAGGTQVNSNTVSATWIVPVNSISTTSASGMFFPNNGTSYNFDISPTATPLFTQTFPSITFNPPAGVIPGNNSIGVGTRPFTDVITDEKGTFVGTIAAKGNGYLPGVVPGNMGAFEAVFTGTFVVKNGGPAVISMYVDNSFILGIGGGATKVSGPTYGGAPQITPFNEYPVMGAYSTSASGTSMTVTFPGPGTYPYELDYVECCGWGGGDTMSLMMTAGAPSGSSATPPTASLVLSPTSVAAQPVGGKEQFTVVATDAAGNPVPNLSVGLVISLNDSQELSATTNASGSATFSYVNKSPGTDQVQAVAIIDGMVAYSNVVNVPWTASPGSGTPVSGSCGTLSVTASAPNAVVLPNTLPLTGSATDTQGGTISYLWSEVSGPAGVSFANATQASTTAQFTVAGSYQLQLAASDANCSSSAVAEITVVVDQPTANGGWIGSPAYGAPVSGIVPITIATGVTLGSGTLTVYPANNPLAVTTLNSNTTGSGGTQIGLWDTTQVQNGAYWITLQATNSQGQPEYSLVLVNVVGNFKPGRVTSTVTDLVVPANGLPINIQRTYDSLNANTSGDFGYGWNLGTTVQLSVGPRDDVTFTLGGIRRTFYFTPQPNGFLPFYVPVYTPEPGLHGTLVSAGSGCSDLFNYLTPDGSLWACVGGGLWTPPGYVYTDPSGTQYTITASGQLQSIVDKNGNTLTITANGITSSTGLSVPFVRDSSGRITSITDPQGNEYQYSYDTSGNLASVTYPTISTSSTYTYDSNHHYLSGTDFKGNPLPTTDYFQSTVDSSGHCQGECDPNGLPLNGRLKSVTDPLNETTSYAYNLLTNTTTITYPPDAGGNVGTARMVYDTMGDVLSSTDPLSHKTTNTYDGNQNLITTTDPLNHTTCYTYDGNGNRTSVSYPGVNTCTSIVSTTTYNQFSEPSQTVDELGNVRTFNYDVNFNPQNVTDSLGTLASFVFNNDGTMQAGAIGFDISVNPSKASQFTYDADGNMASRTDALGRTTSYTYNSLGQKVTMAEPPLPGTSASAATTNYSYDAFGNLTQTIAPLGRTTKSTYDANGNKLSDTDPNNNVTNYTYDALNRLTQTNYPDSSVSKKTYDFRGNVVDEWDQAQNQTHHVYDPAGRQTSVTQAYSTSNATTTTYSYYDDGRKESETDALGHTTTYSYDIAGDLTVVSGVNGTFTYAYDNARNRVSMTDGNSNATRYQYDARKRLSVTTYPDATTKTNTYDGPGNLTSVTDQNGNVVAYAYDAANRLQSVTQTNSPNAPNNVTSYSYDPLGNLMGVNDANSHLTESNFDLLSEQKTKTLPDGSLTETRQYDAAGNLTSLTHFNSKTTTYTYDNLNRLLSRTPDPTTGEPTVSFTYTATGKRHTMTDASGTTNYTYDSIDRLTQKATPEGRLNYNYDAAGHLASMTTADGNVSVSYTYDSLNRLHTVVDGRLAGNQTTTYTYDTANNVATVTYPNTVQTAFTYDQLNRAKQLATSQTGYLYTFDAAGNRKTVSELNNRSVSWNFDGIYRLTGESITGASGNENGSAGYVPDPVGNRASAASSIPGLSPVGGTFNADDELASESYDSDGNTIATGGKTFAYDTENHLMSMNGGAVTILYDGDGNRVKKITSSGTTTYLVDDLNPTGYPQVVEELVSGAVTRQYTYGLQRISEAQSINGTWTPSFYGYDGFGTVRQLTSSAGAITDTYDYDAFGNKINSTGTTPNNMLYRGEFFDSDLGLYYLRARYYDTMTGRFVSMDPENGIVTDPRTLHKYLYAGGDPVNGSDPTGRASKTATAGGDAGEYVGLLIILFGAERVAQTAAQNSGSIASSLRQVGEDLSCDFHRLACLLTRLNDLDGDVYGTGRCQECYLSCVKNDGEWPSRATRTRGSVRCDYWNYK